MKTNDIKKGMRVRLNNGWYGTMADNMKGNTRMVDVEGIERETGSVYSHDIAYVQRPDKSWELIEHTDAQLKLRDTVNGVFGS